MDNQHAKSRYRISTITSLETARPSLIYVPPEHHVIDTLHALSSLVGGALRKVKTQWTYYFLQILHFQNAAGQRAGYGVILLLLLTCAPNGFTRI